MGVWFSQEPGMDTLEEDQEDMAVVQKGDHGWGCNQL